jgi:hypothetical protein
MGWGLRRYTNPPAPAPPIPRAAVEVPLVASPPVATTTYFHFQDKVNFFFFNFCVKRVFALVLNQTAKVTYGLGDEPVGVDEDGASADCTQGESGGRGKVGLGIVPHRTSSASTSKREDNIRKVREYDAGSGCQGIVIQTGRKARAMRSRTTHVLRRQHSRASSSKTVRCKGSVHAELS